MEDYCGIDELFDDANVDIEELIVPMGASPPPKDERQQDRRKKSPCVGALQALRFTRAVADELIGGPDGGKRPPRGPKVLVTAKKNDMASKLADLEASQEKLANTVYELMKTHAEALSRLEDQARLHRPYPRVTTAGEKVLFFLCFSTAVALIIPWMMAWLLGV